MITLIEIQKSISRKLNSKFNDHFIYGEEVKQGLKRPAFFINIIPVSTENFPVYKDKLINIDIMYFSKNETYVENLNMISELESLFKTLKIQDRALTIESLNFRIVDDILHCSFSLDFMDCELISIDTPLGQVYLPEHEISEELGYTPETITVMQELEMQESESEVD